MSASVASLKTRVSVLCSFRLSPPVPTRLPGTSRWGRGPAGGRWMSQTGENLRPLEGVRVLDLTRVLAGPFATMILGDLGAEVIKVERPGAGDDTRVWGPPFISSESIYFLSVNRNKKSIAVDLKHPRGAKIIKELTAVCDVLVENFLPGKLQQLNLGFEQLSKVNPQIIFCSISGYGQTGPRSQSPGYDSIASAVSGMMHITGPEGGEPVRPGVAMTDLATGLYAHGAIMAGLLQRQKTGRGLHIDCNLLSSQVSCLSHIAANYLNAGKEARRWGTAHESIVPYQAFETKDGHIVVAAGNDKQFVQVCEVLELIELNEDQRYKTNKLRVQNRKELLHTLTQRFLQKNTADWLRSFEGTSVPVGPINSIQEVFSDPQDIVESSRDAMKRMLQQKSLFQTTRTPRSRGPHVVDWRAKPSSGHFLRKHSLQADWIVSNVKHNNLIQEMSHPTAGPISVPGPAVRFSSFTPGGPTPPPLIGQHTVQVLRDTLSYSDDVIKGLLDSKAVVQNKMF